MTLRPFIALVVASHALSARALDVDSGMDAVGFAKALSSSQPSAISPQLAGFSSQHLALSSKPSTTGWVRLRGIDLGKTPETREALLKLRTSGFKTCVFLRLSVADWKKKYLPDDLRDSYEHGRKLGTTFGDLVDAWEVDNEPDLGFVPESAERYTAFLKATYLGLKDGAAEAISKPETGRRLGADGEANLKPEVSDPKASPSSTQVSGFRFQVSERAPLVVMGSLGLPPGPWLERFAANGGFAYTDGYNYHYYGYAEDFTGVYKQHEAALRELGAGNLEPGADSLKLIAKSFPIFLTEVGYGTLGKEARDTKEGRLRQWRWFKSVGEQANALHIEAPMAFYLPPYLEYDTSEYGLTVPAEQSTGKPETGRRLGADGEAILKPEVFSAGGIEYAPGDFGVAKVAPWMMSIGKQLGGNQITPALAQWHETRKASGFRFQVSGFSAGGSRSWSVTTAPPSRVVIDFLPGEGISHVKRYNGLFVTGRKPPVHPKPEAGNLKPDGPAKPLPPSPSPSAPSRSEELILQVRTQNGNLYEVYPTRQATPDWQRFMESGANFTMSFYGRAALPWRFKDNQPASLVMVLYPKQLPAVYEFRRPQLLKLSALSASVSQSENLGQTPGWQQPSTARSQPSASFRYAAGTVVLYNFSDKPVTGHLELPSALAPVPTTLSSTAHPASTSMTLAPGERREIPVSIQVTATRYERIPTEIRFVCSDQHSQLSALSSQLSDSSVSRHRTDLLPDIGGMPATLVADLLSADNRQLTTDNRDLVATRQRASEEAAMVEQRAESKGPMASADSSGSLSTLPHTLTIFAQTGATVEPTSDGFSITVTDRVPGKPRRIEFEIPWPDGLAFGEEEFLSMEFRLKP